MVLVAPLKTPAAELHDIDVFLSCVAVLLLSQIGSAFWRVYKRYSCSEKSNPDLWADFSKGDTLLDYQFSLMRSKEIVLNLINPEVGPAGVEGDEAGPCTTFTTATSGKRKSNSGSGFQTLVDSSVSIAASAAKHARLAELVASSKTLKTARDAAMPADIVMAIEAELSAAVRSSVRSRPGATSVGSDAAAGSPSSFDLAGQEPSAEGLRGVVTGRESSSGGGRPGSADPPVDDEEPY